MRQFLLSSNDIRGSIATLKGEAFHHLHHVLRLKTGAKVILCDELGNRFEAKLIHCGDKQAEFEILQAMAEKKLGCRLRLLVCLPKGTEFEEILDAGTQLGFEEFVPIISKRTIVKIQALDIPKKLERWTKILRAACQQSNQSQVPRVLAPLALENAEHLVAEQACLCAWERADVPLAACLKEFKKPPAKLSLLVGPEGGLTAEEAKWLEQRGTKTVSLGPLILRTPVACQFFISAIRFWESFECLS